MSRGRRLGQPASTSVPRVLCSRGRALHHGLLHDTAALLKTDGPGCQVAPTLDPVRTEDLSEEQDAAKLDGRLNGDPLHAAGAG
jgi:hypothetical protein